VSAPEDIAAALTRLRAGNLVAFPTETVYGLGADAANPAAIRRVFELKGRPSTNPLIVHVSGENQARTLVAEWPHDASALARAFWPGPLTIVLPKSPIVPDIVTGGGPTVGVRCPDHHITLTLLEAFGPLVGPSANPSGRVSPTTAAHVRASFPSDEVFILDGGPSRAGIESTVISLIDNPPRILRPGVVSAEQLSAAIGREVTSHAPDSGPLPTAHSPLPSPGLLPAHYAPLTPTHLRDRASITKILRATIDPTIAIILYPLETPPPHAAILMPTTADAYAARLYAALREADECRVTQILIETPPSTGPIWEAITDRLRRATHGSQA
jgi:L-threonylcarbamoyladenylate synthase